MRDLITGRKGKSQSEGKAMTHIVCAYIWGGEREREIGEREREIGERDLRERERERERERDIKF